MDGGHAQRVFDDRRRQRRELGKHQSRIQALQAGIVEDLDAECVRSLAFDLHVVVQVGRDVRDPAGQQGVVQAARHRDRSVQSVRRRDIRFLRLFRRHAADDQRGLLGNVAAEAGHYQQTGAAFDLRVARLDRRFERSDPHDRCHAGRRVVRRSGRTGPDGQRREHHDQQNQGGDVAGLGDYQLAGRDDLAPRAPTAVRDCLAHDAFLQES